MLKRVLSWFKSDSSEGDSDNTLQSSFKKGQCPDCASTKWYEGPSGGMSTNWFCANDDCKSGFNVCAVPGGPLLIERIGKR